MIKQAYIDRYMQSHICFRNESRTIQEGWALDGIRLFDNNLHKETGGIKQFIKKDKIIKSSNTPTGRFYLALANGFTPSTDMIEIMNPENWKHTSRTKKENPFFYTKCDSIDAFFLTSYFPLWIPSSLSEMGLAAVCFFAQYEEMIISDMTVDIKELDNQYEVAIISLEDDSEFLKGVGEDPWIAMYDLYEKAWMKNWKANKPSITQIKGYQDLVTIGKTKMMLVNSSRNLDYNLRFYHLGKDHRFAEEGTYIGKYIFLEGTFDIFGQGKSYVYNNSTDNSKFKKIVSTVRTSS